MKETTLDETDLRILDLMQRDASLAVAEIATRVGLSATPCWRRIKRLREAGVIRATAALLDPEKIGLGFTAYAFIKLALPSTDNMLRFEETLRQWPEVTLAERITGVADYLIKVVTRDMHAYDDFLRTRLLGTDLVADVQSRIVLASVKRDDALPLPHAPAPATAPRV